MRAALIPECRPCQAVEESPCRRTRFFASAVSAGMLNLPCIPLEAHGRGANVRRTVVFDIVTRSGLNGRGSPSSRRANGNHPRGIHHCLGQLVFFANQQTGHPTLLSYRRCPVSDRQQPADQRQCASMTVSGWTSLVEAVTNRSAAARWSGILSLGT